MTPWVSRLIAANVVAFLVTWSVPLLHARLELIPIYVPTQPWRLVTYMFLHGSPLHIIFNMLALFFLGPRLEARLGGPRFLALYFVSGLIAGLLSMVYVFLSPFTRIVGASGAITGVLLGFARYWPRDVIYLLLLPIQARWLVIVLAAGSLGAGVLGLLPGIAHFAHLGGIVGGFLFLVVMERSSAATRFKAIAQPQAVTRPRTADLARWQRIDRSTIHPLNQDEVERLMGKIETAGIASLTPDERAFLDRFSTSNH